MRRRRINPIIRPVLVIAAGIAVTIDSIYMGSLLWLALGAAGSLCGIIFLFKLLHSRSS